MLVQTLVLLIVYVLLAFAETEVHEVSLTHQPEQLLEQVIDVSLTASSPCICTTVPCPQAGYNTLTVGRF